MFIWLLYGLLAVTIAAVGSIFFTASRVEAVPMPSLPRVRAAVVDEITRLPGIRRVVEVGSGWGGLALRIARSNPEKRVIGIEASAVPLLVSRARRAVRSAPENVEFRHADFRSMEIEPRTAYVCYLAPPAMRSVRELVENGAREGVVVVSALFAVPGWEPVNTRTARDVHATTIYVYEPGGGARDAGGGRTIGEV